MNALSIHHISLNQPGILTESYITVQAAARVSGYNAQYLRRLLRAGKLDGVRVGQVWLIRLDALVVRLQKSEHTPDKRCGPKNNQPEKMSTGVNIPCLQA